MRFFVAARLFVGYSDAVKIPGNGANQVRSISFADEKSKPDREAGAQSMKSATSPTPRMVRLPLERA
jgi:hypothetical protein